MPHREAPVIKTHDWSNDVFRIIQSRRITTIATVPDAGLTRVLTLCNDDHARRIVTLTSEQEGIGLIVGLWLGGQRGALFMQSSGTGNCINALSLPANVHAPCPMLITMRGDTGEGNPWQVPMGRAAEATLRAMGVTCYLAERSEDVGELFDLALKIAFAERTATAVLVSQQIIGIKHFKK